MMSRGKLGIWVWWVAIGILVSSAVTFFAVYGGVRGFSNISSLEEERVYDTHPSSSTTASSSAIFYRPLIARKVIIPSEGKVLYADLDLMQLRLYYSGALVREIPIVAKAKPGSGWEVPEGEYRIIQKEEQHFSLQAHAFMPYSIAFSANFYIHGIPKNPARSDVPREFQAGCIRLTDSDAQSVYEFTENDMPLFIKNSSVMSSNGWEYVFLNKIPPKISARSFIVGDVDASRWFLEKNKDTEHPIASITKLMSAIVTRDYVQPSMELTVVTSDLDIYGDQGHLRQGEILTADNLLSPLLLSSSNDAAYTLSRSLGTEDFIKKMNEETRAIGLKHTRYSDPSGLHTENISTAEDLITLVRYIRDRYPDILDLTRTPRKILQTNKTKHTWYSYNWKSGDNEFLGGKIGYIGTAGKTMVALFRVPLSEFTTRDIGISVLGSSDEQYDVKKLIDWVKGSVVYTQSTRGHDVAAVPLEMQDAGFRQDEPYSLLFVGDMMMDRGVREMVEKQGGGDYFFPFTAVSKEIQDADVAFGNLEGPVSDKGTQQGSQYSFRMDPAVIKALYDVGFDAVSIANNHVGDYGRDAFEDTLRRLRFANIAAIGGGWNAVETAHVQIIERAGKRIGFLGFSDVGPRWLNAGPTTAGISLSSVDAVQNAVRQSRDKVDILIVSFHFGEEYATQSSKRQQELAHAAIDAGATIIVGHHPHVPEEIEQYKGGVIAYSLGNFVFDQAFSTDTQHGLILKLFMRGNTIDHVEQKEIYFTKYFQPVFEHL